MSDDDQPDGPIPGWPVPPVPGPDGGAGTPPTPPPSNDPTTPFGAPPPAAPQPNVPPVPGSGPSPYGGAYPPPGGYAAPGSYPTAPGYPPGPGGYPPAGYGYPMQQEHPQGTTILILGIASIVCCGLLGPVAWIMGNKAIREIDARPGQYSNRGMVQAGRIIGIIASVLLIISAVAWIALIVLGAASGSSS